MKTTAKYDREKLVELLSERATFEKSAVGLYDALLDALEGMNNDELLAARERLEQCRDEEQEHADWLDDLIDHLGGRPGPHAMSEAVMRESRAIEQVIRTKPDGAGPLPMVYAMLSAELMDAEGWNLLLELADEMDDEPAVRELRSRAEHEAEHLELIRELARTLAKETVEYQEGRATTTSEPREDTLDVDVPGPARATTDHDTIREWAEARGGRPAHVRGTGRDGDLGILRIDFPGFSGERTLEHVGWDEWLDAFDRNGLALVYEERLASGQPSRFNKLVSRETVRRRQAGERGASAHKRGRRIVHHRAASR